MSELEAGAIVNDTWEVEAPLGRGGMGEVWRVRHTRLQHKVAALKTLVALHLDDVALTRFRHEAETMARLEHPNIVQVYDYGSQADGSPWLVMELLRGESLRQRLQRGAMTLSEVRRLVAQVASALSLAHAQGIVHRDLKPANLFLVPSPGGFTAKVLDFGIAKLLAPNTIDTGNDVLIGTPEYMSPEQARGENDQLTAASDVFSLASVCFEALSGRPPFRDETLIKTILKVISAPAPELEGLEPSVALALAAAFQKDPTQRCTMEWFSRRFCGEPMREGVEAHVVLAPSPPKVRRQQATDEVARVSRSSVQRTGLLFGVVIALGVAAVGTIAVFKEHPVYAATAPAEVVLPPTPVATPRLPTPIIAPVAQPRRKRSKMSRAQSDALHEVEHAFEDGRFREVLRLARGPLVAPLRETLELAAKASCALGEEGSSAQFQPLLDPWERAAVDTYCASIHPFATDSGR